MKFKLVKTKLGFLLIGFGLVLIFIACFLKFYTNHKSQDLIQSYYKTQKSNIQTAFLEPIKKVNSESAQAPNTQALKEISFTNLDFLQDRSLTEGDIIGILYIPKIALEVALCEGVSNKTLKYAVGHFPDTALPAATGNCAIIGHRNYTYGEFFNRLDELEQNDEIQIFYEGYTITYKVSSSKIVQPEEIEVLEQGTEKEITLITCTPISTGTHRLVVKGILKGIKK
ncbi:sortase [Sporanaerobium hydrogeniformans]|uniref:Sortase n=1 Tax=Sporanaerobium hydrogeniformans TaxID=3072179 RepID=A0AC61D9H9_9FIRM|nr:class D sortase [Sporanaerobium hydrogeniformans]PHV69401.1 sortase [Sporanaerobium hydrogeniformans]